MSYQIKSTPFFRRMLSTSKNNGQLQKLKEEYERIREFNEHTIDSKMRQVRLKRLFRHIEEIKESSMTLAKRRRMGGPDRMKSEEERRIETFVKSRELGKEYSRFNALLLDHRPETVINAPTTMVTVAPVDDKTKALIAKRISYGNESSRNNKEKIEKNVQKRTIKRMLHIDIGPETKTKLQQRLEYGNSCSSFNMSKIAKRHVRHKIATESAEPIVQLVKPRQLRKLRQRMRSPPPPPQRPEPQLPDELAFMQPMAQQLLPALCEINCESELQQKVMPQALPASLQVHTAHSVLTHKPRLYKTFEQLQNSKIRLTAGSQSYEQLSRNERARKYWRMLGLTVCNQFDTTNARRNQQPLDQTDDQLFQLRSIPNDTHLPFSPLSDKLAPYLSEPEADPDEVLIKLQSLIESEPSHVTVTEMQPPDQLPSIVHEGTPQTIVQKVQKFVKIFEPYVREVAEKEAFEAFGVQKLRSIFEHNIDNID